MAEPTAPCNARPRSQVLDEPHEVIRALGLRKRGGGPSPECSESDMEEIPPPTDNAPTGSTPPAGSVQALCHA